MPTLTHSSIQTSPRADVPCGDCRLCCRNMVVIVSQQMGDDVERFESVPVPGVEGFFQIPILDNGDCHYLGPQGCSIHEQAPVMCQAFSCIAAARNLTTRKVAEGFRDGILVPAVMKRGRELLRKRQKR